MGARIKTLRIQGFRGFNSSTEIPLGSQVIIIYGLNGSGKSSLTEAIEWLFFDGISRRRLSPCPGEYSSGIYLRNLYYKGSESPFVEVILDQSGKEITVYKELITEKQSKIFVDKKEIQEFTEIFPDFKSQHRPILAQVEISALVNTEQKDRWEQLSKILGQEQLSVLREHLISLRKNKKDAQYTRDDETYKGSCRANEELGLLPDFITAFSSMDWPKLEKIIRKLQISYGLDEKKSVDDNLKVVISRLTGTELGKQLTELGPIPDSTTENSVNQLRDDFIKISRLIQESAKGQLKPDEVTFFEKGLKLASPPLCPFCLNETLKQTRIDEIKGRLDEDKVSIQAKKDLDTVIETMKQAFHTNCGLQNLIPDVEKLKIISQKLADLGVDEFSENVQILEEEIQTTITDLSAQLIMLYNGYYDALVKYHYQKKPAKTEEAETALEKYLQYIIDKLSGLNERWEKMRNQILSSLPKGDEEQGKEMRKWIQIERCMNFLKNKGKYIRKHYLIEKFTPQIQSKLETYEKKQVANLLTEHSEEIKQYYEDLNPGESVNFQKVEVSGGVRRQAKLIASGPNEEIINPVTIFSEAHVNSLSLSIYFPQRVDRNPMWDVILLDDPVQSMDRNHSQSLIEILAEKAKTKQVIVLTHAQEFAEKLYHRFKGSTEITYLELIDNPQDSPKINIKFGPTLEYLNFVGSNLRGSSVIRESAANALRKSIEAVIGEIMIKFDRTLSQVEKWTSQGMQQLFDQIERIQQVDKDDIAKLKCLLYDGHGGSHAWSLRDNTPGGLLQGSKNVEEVYSKYLP